MEYRVSHFTDATSQGKFPKLQQVRCDAEQKLDDDHALGAMFAAAGVDFSYDSWPYSKPTLRDSDVPSWQGGPLPLPAGVDSDVEL